MRVVLTRTVCKDVDYINGMAGRVLSYNPHTKAVCVEALTGYKVMVWPWTDIERDNTVYYPIRP
eukprot:8439568-Prorocentrum_lima.AAC.1